MKKCSFKRIIGQEESEVFLGGARIGAGSKKKALADKIAEENLGERTLTVIAFKIQQIY